MFRSLRSASQGRKIVVPGARRRWLSSATPLELKHDIFNHSQSPNNQPEKGPLLILHGLFGSKRNWHSLSKAFARELQRPVYALDLRNHGDSPHGEPMDYATMATDVLHFCERHSLKDVSLLGHSMGGKVAMALALNPSLPDGLLSYLVVGDISPIRGKISEEFQRYTKGMLKIEEEGLKTRKAAFEKLAAYEEDQMIRQFLLTSLDTTPPGEHLKFRIPLQTISKAIPDLGDFPYAPGETSWDGPTLFVRGSMSNYIQLKHVDLMRRFFPNMDLETLEASHWLHAEKPKDFLDVVSRFIK